MVIMDDLGSGSLPGPSAPASTDKLDDHHNHCHYQEYMNEAANGGAGDQSQSPEYDENYCDCKQHQERSFSVRIKPGLLGQNGPAISARLCDSAHWTLIEASYPSQKL